MALLPEGIGIDPGLTAEVFERGYRSCEPPITRDWRGDDEGRKIYRFSE